MSGLRIAMLSAGSLSHVAPYIEFFKRHGHDVHWFAYDPPKADLGVPTYDISHGARGSATTSKWRYTLAGLTLRRLIRKLSPDVLHGHYATSAGVICRLSGFRPYVVTAHGSDLLTTRSSVLWRAVLRRTLGRAALVNPVSQEIATNVHELGIDPARMLITTVGVDTASLTFPPERQRKGPMRILCTRTLDRIYDPLTIVRAGALLRDRGVPFKLTFAARGPLLPVLEAAVVELGLRQQVDFLGGYRQAELLGLLHSHDLYVSASLSDGTSLSLLEAMACGLFPIVSRIVSNLAWLEEGRTALMFDCGDPRQVAEQVERAITDNQLRHEAVEWNRSVVERGGDREKNMLMLEAAFLQIARGGQTRKPAEAC